MKSMRLVGIIAALLIPIALAIPASGKGFIFLCGENIEIGAPQNIVMSNLAGCSTVKVSDGHWILRQGDVNVGSVQFRAGVSVRVERRWTPELSTGNAVAQAIYGAILALSREGYKSCQISTFSNSTPDVNLREAAIECGEKTIKIGLYEYQSKAWTQIEEILQ